MARHRHILPAGGFRVPVLAALVLALLAPGWSSAPPAVAQVQQGATMTVLRGQVAVIRGDGSAVQPAPSGTVVNAGDEIRTLGSTGALLTFFTGTEIELGESTIMVVEQVSREGDRVDVSLRQVLGASVSRVQSLGSPGSSYRIEAGGAVALVRGTTFALVGPVTTSVGNVVVIVCLEDCAPSSTFAGCPLGPFGGYGVVVERGRVASECVAFSVDRSAGLFNAAFEAVTTVEQNVQGETRGVPPGQVAAGQRQESAARADREARDEDKEDDKDANEPLIATAPPTVLAPHGAVSPTGPPVACNATTTSGGGLSTRQPVELGRASGTFVFSFDAFGIPDRFDVVYEGRTIFSTNGFVSGGGSASIPYSGSSTSITVVVTGSSPGTLFVFRAGCPS